MSIPVLRGAIDSVGGNWSIDVFVPQLIVCDLAADYTECVVEGVLGRGFEYVSEYRKILMILFERGHVVK